MLDTFRKQSVPATAPIHPPLRVEPCCDIGRAEPAIVMLLCEISNDHIRFPKPHVTIVDGRDEAVRIHGDMLRGVGHPEVTSGIDPFIIQAELVATPEHLLNIDRVSSAPNPEHSQRRMIANGLAECWLEIKETLVERRGIIAIQS